MRKYLSMLIITLFQTLGFSATEVLRPYKLSKGFVVAKETAKYTYLQNIPYAKPPVGSLRWKAPQDKQNWKGLHNGFKFTARCPQLEGLFSGTEHDQIDFTRVIGQEDCLYLNVWKPRGNRGKKRPVFFWIHGGSNYKGYALDEGYDAKYLVNKLDAIVVTINYRLGMFGSFKNKKLLSNNLLDSSGNYVTLDLIKGLDWVRENAKYLGADPENITIAGESAGCMNVWGLIQTPLAKGKFSKAYCASGFPNNYPVVAANQLSNRMIERALVLKNMAKDLKESKRLLKEMGPAEVESFLYSLTSEEIVKSSPVTIPYQHISDGHVFSKLGLNALLLGRFNRVPIMTGHNKDEGTLFLAIPFLDISQSEFWEIVNGRESTRKLDQFIDSKEFSRFEHQNKDLYKTSKLIYDLVFTLVRGHLPKVYRYSLSFKSEFEPWKSVFGAAHAIDIPLIFQTKELKKDHIYKFLNRDLRDPETRYLQKTMGSYLKNFIYTGNPNSKSLPKWKEWNQLSLRPYVLEIDRKNINLKRDHINPIASYNAIHSLYYLIHEFLGYQSKL